MCDTHTRTSRQSVFHADPMAYADKKKRVTVLWVVMLYSTRAFDGARALSLWHNHAIIIVISWERIGFVVRFRGAGAGRPAGWRIGGTNEHAGVGNARARARHADRIMEHRVHTIYTPHSDLWPVPVRWARRRRRRRRRCRRTSERTSPVHRPCTLPWRSDVYTCRCGYTCANGSGVFVGGIWRGELAPEVRNMRTNITFGIIVKPEFI